MRKMTKTVALTGALVLFTLAGCFSLGRKTPTLEQYVLGGTQLPAGTAAQGKLIGLTVGVRRLDLAAYLATPAIVVRRGVQQIITSEFHRWGEDPADGINRAFAHYLAAEAGVRAVDSAPWPIGSRYDYLIQLHIARLEGAAPDQLTATEGEARVSATWEIIRQEDGAVLARGATDHRESNWKVGDYAGLVTLLDRGVNALARDVAACMASVVPAAPRAAGSIEAVAPAVACTPRSEP